ncbi:MAG: LacI family DNA-binding transcriptional regulator [Actinomycetota bacterium]
MGRHAFAIRSVARQAGVSEATVDRVLHGRDGVRPATAARVRRAIADLERQQAAFELGGTTLTIDLVMQSPRRFSSAVWSAFDEAIPTLRPADVRVRPHLDERVEPGEIADVLRAIGRRGSDAVVLKAPDTDEVVDAVAEVAERGVPVFTMVTDLPTSRRTAYIGIDNRAAGATAAYLIDRWLPAHDPSTTPTVLVTLSSQRFRGEEEREIGFRRTARTIAPDWRIVELVETEGLDDTVTRQLGADTRRLDTVAGDGPVAAVYSIGGGNQGILDTLADLDHWPEVFIAHDLDGDNLGLLTTGRISAVLHHDLRADAHRACHLALQARGNLPGRPTTEPAPVQVVTPYNIPPRYPGRAGR